MNLVTLNCLMALTFAFSVAASPLACEYEGVMYMNGRFRPKPCKWCYCNDGTVTCSTMTCDVRVCPAGETLVQYEDRCCPICAPVEINY